MKFKANFIPRWPHLYKKKGIGFKQAKAMSFFQEGDRHKKKTRMC